jgi:hypothetical protein
MKVTIDIEYVPGCGTTTDKIVISRPAGGILLSGNDCEVHLEVRKFIADIFEAENGRSILALRTE